MSDIQHRLRASVRMGAVHGDTHERSVCARQMVEAADEIERLIRERDALAKDAQPERQPVSEAHREAVLGAVARGWCHPENANKEMDATLAIAIADEVLAINRSEPTDAQIVAVADVLLAWEAEISNRVSARVLAEDVIRAALAAKESK